MRPGIASLSSIVVSSGTTSERTNCLTARTMSCKSSCSIVHLLAKCTRARGRLEPNILEDCGHSLTTPDAHALKPVAPTATAQLPQQSGQDPPARRSDGMTE